MLRFIKGKCQSGIWGCKRPASYNLYMTVAGVKTWKNVCDQCVLTIEKDNERIWTEAQHIKGVDKTV